MKEYFEITVALRDIGIRPKDFYDCTTKEKVLNEIHVLCQDAYNCDPEAIQNINIPQEFWDDWEENHTI